MENLIAFWGHSGQGIVVTILALCILFLGLRIVKSQVDKKGIGHYTFQMFGLVILLPTILLLSAYGSLDKSVLATLIGAIAGYIFGKSGNPE